MVGKGDFQMKTLIIVAVFAWSSSSMARGITGNNGWSCIVDGVAYRCGSQASCPLGNSVGMPCKAKGKAGKTQKNNNSLNYGSGS